MSALPGEGPLPEVILRSLVPRPNTAKIRGRKVLMDGPCEQRSKLKPSQQCQGSGYDETKQCQLCLHGKGPLPEAILRKFRDAEEKTGFKNHNRAFLDLLLKNFKKRYTDIHILSLSHPVLIPHPPAEHDTTHSLWSVYFTLIRLL